MCHHLCILTSMWFVKCTQLTLCLMVFFLRQGQCYRFIYAKVKDPTWEIQNCTCTFYMRDYRGLQKNARGECENGLQKEGEWNFSVSAKPLPLLVIKERREMNERVLKSYLKYIFMHWIALGSIMLFFRATKRLCKQKPTRNRNTLEFILLNCSLCK